MFSEMYAWDPGQILEMGENVLLFSVGRVGSEAGYRKYSTWLFCKIGNKIRHYIEESWRIGGTNSHGKSFPGLELQSRATTTIEQCCRHEIVAFHWESVVFF
jgi:hypothetical protein